MASFIAHVQSTSMIGDNFFFCYVVSYDPWKGISQGCKYGHIHGTFD
jgi:hypothetical protein